MPQKRVPGIHLERTGFRGAALPIDCTGEDQPVNRFQSPPSLDQASSQKIEQLRVSRGGTLASKVVRSLHQPLTKVIMPDAIHDHPRHQFPGAMLGIRQPLAKRAESALRLAKPVVIFAA